MSLISLSLFSILTGVFLLGLTHCASLSPEVPAWEKETREQLSSLGQRNWIVIAEPSYSALSGPGAHVIMSDKSAPDVLYFVLDTLESLAHTEPKILLPLELGIVDNDYAPGIKELNKRLKKITLGRNVQEAHHESLRRLMLEAAKNYKVLIIKTTTGLPYSNIYIELDSGYWGNESQDSLNEKILQKMGKPDALEAPKPVTSSSSLKENKEENPAPPAKAASTTTSQNDDSGQVPATPEGQSLAPVAS